MLFDLHLSLLNKGTPMINTVFTFRADQSVMFVQPELMPQTMLAGFLGLL